MASNVKNLSEYSDRNTGDVSDKTFGIVVSEWNDQVTGALLEGALETLKEQGVKKKNIRIKYVPGSFELPLGAQLLAQQKSFDAVICLGCVIQGETRHFDFISLFPYTTLFRFNRKSVV